MTDNDLLEALCTQLKENDGNLLTPENYNKDNLLSLIIWNLYEFTEMENEILGCIVTENVTKGGALETLIKQEKASKEAREELSSNHECISNLITNIHEKGYTDNLKLLRFIRLLKLTIKHKPILLKGNSDSSKKYDFLLKLLYTPEPDELTEHLPINDTRRGLNYRGEAYYSEQVHVYCYLLSTQYTNEAEEAFWKDVKNLDLIESIDNICPKNHIKLARNIAGLLYVAYVLKNDSSNLDMKTLIGIANSEHSYWDKVAELKKEFIDDFNAIKNK